MTAPVEIAAIAPERSDACCGEVEETGARPVVIAEIEVVNVTSG